MKIYKKSVVACALFSIAGAGNCGIGENSWFFMPLEKVTYDFTAGEEHMGLETGCDFFAPGNIFFAITYSGTPAAERRVYVETDDPRNVTYDKAAKTFYVTNPKRMAIGLPYGGTYTIKNRSLATIKGANCDAGFY
ncbi:hypothetical protein [uncultured Xanthomonas sp.]|uniref:hypothetical protein n=1 Tax=uncultured Xanthomonas sp. TaxID=152831 RepID=UPI0025E2BA1C|nr:hypothetical protein [uncultured Xanthomonas sp.]